MPHLKPQWERKREPKSLTRSKKSCCFYLHNTSVSSLTSITVNSAFSSYTNPWSCSTSYGFSEESYNRSSSLTGRLCCSGSKCEAVCLWSMRSVWPPLCLPPPAGRISYRSEPGPSWPPYGLATVTEIHSVEIITFQSEILYLSKPAVAIKDRSAAHL